MHGTAFMEMQSEQSVTADASVFALGHATAGGRYYDSSTQGTFLLIQNNRIRIKWAGTTKDQSFSNDGINNTYIFYVARDNGVFKARRNNTDYGQVGTGTGTGTIKFLRLGSKVAFFDGDIQEMVFFSANKTSEAGVMIEEINSFYSVYS